MNWTTTIRGAALVALLSGCAVDASQEPARIYRAAGEAEALATCSYRHIQQRAPSGMDTRLIPQPDGTHELRFGGAYFYLIALFAQDGPAETRIMVREAVDPLGGLPRGERRAWRFLLRPALETCSQRIQE